jgi:hypothetical protein
MRIYRDRISRKTEKSKSIFGGGVNGISLSVPPYGDISTRFAEVGLLGSSEPRGFGPTFFDAAILLI